MPLAPQKDTVQISVPLSPSYLSLWGPDFWDRDDWVLHSLGADFLGKNHSLASLSLPTSPGVCWAEPPSTMCCLLCTGDGKVHCWLPLEHLQWYSMLLGSAALQKLYIHCYSLTKRNHFSYNFAVSCCPANLLLTVNVVCLPPAIGPTLGTNFVATGFRPSPLEG